MARTYTVHGHFKNRDGRLSASWTRTGLSKSAAQKLAREQRAETGGVARVVPDEESVSRHATKKSPAQLDREIASSLKRVHKSIAGRRSHATKITSSEGGKPRLLKVGRGKTFAGQRSIAASVQYPGEPASRVEFVGPSGGGSGPVVMIYGKKRFQTFVTDPSRFGAFGPEWVRRFFDAA